METCILFVFCFNVTNADSLDPAGTILWEQENWAVERIIRNDDSTDRGCRLSYRSDNGGRLELDAYYLAGRLRLTAAEEGFAEGARNIGIFAVEFEGADQNEYWGIASVAVEMMPTEIVGDLPGMSVAGFIEGLTERRATTVALLDVDRDVWITHFTIEGLDAASEPFMECYKRLPL